MNNYCVSDLSSVEHYYKYKHLCSPKTRQMKMRIGVILDGRGTFSYVNQKLEVKKGDVILIPEKIFCYSEWVGEPDIRVIYLNFNLSMSDSLIGYDLQSFPFSCAGERKEAIDSILKIHSLLSGENGDRLVAYAEFYMLLSRLLPYMEKSRKKYKKELCEAIIYISDNWNKDFNFSDVAAHCCTCESKLYKLFKEQLGDTPNNYLNSIKINYAIHYLEHENYSVNEVSDLCNFHSDTYFRKVFRKFTGINPSDYKKQFSNY